MHFCAISVGIQAKIWQLSAGDFKSQEKLKELHLGQNQLEEIPLGAFEQAKSLEKLFLFSNNIEKIKAGAFRGLINLSSLMLNNNLLKDVDSNAFLHVPNLRKLCAIIFLLKLSFYFNLFADSLTATNCVFSPSTVSSHWLSWFRSNWQRIRGTATATFCTWPSECPGINVPPQRNYANLFCSWLTVNRRKVWDTNPTCRGPGDLGSRSIEDMTFDDLCDGQWASMTRFYHRVPQI